MTIQLSLQEEVLLKYLFNPATNKFESLEPTMRDRFALGGGVIQGEKVGDRENFAFPLAIPFIAPGMVPTIATLLGVTATTQAINTYLQNNPEAIDAVKQALELSGQITGVLPFGTKPGEQPEIEEELKELSKPVGLPPKKQEKPKSEGTKIPEPKKDEPPGIEPPDALPDLPGFSKDEEAKSPQIFTLTEGLFDNFDIGDAKKQKKPRIEKITKKQQKEPLPKDFTELLDNQDEAAMKIAEMYRDREFNNPNLYKLFRDYTLKFHNGNSINAAKDFPFVKEINEKLQQRASDRGFKIQFGYGRKRAPIIEVDDQPFKFDSELTDYLQKNPNYLQERIKKLEQFDKKGFYTTGQIAEILGIANDPSANSRINRFIQPYKVGTGTPFTNKTVRSKPGTFAKSPLYSLEDIVRNIEAFSKNKPDKDRIRSDASQLRKVALANFDEGLYGLTKDSITQTISFEKQKFFKELESDEIRKLLNQSINYNIGHQVPVAFMSEKGFQLPIARIPENMDKLYGLNTLVFQDAKVNYELGNIQGKDTTLMKTINDFLEANEGKIVDKELFKKIKTINEESADVQKFKQDKVKEFLNEVYTVGNKKAKRLVHEPYLKDQDKTIGKVILDLKLGDTVELTSIDVDMSDVPNRLRFGKINTVNSEANKTKDLSKEELTKYEKNISSQIKDYYKDVSGAAGLKGIVEDEEFNEVAEIENMINDKFGLGTITTADKAPEPDSSILRRLFEDFKKRRGFAEGSPDPFVDEALAAVNNPNVADQFVKNNTSSTLENIFGKEGERSFIQRLYETVDPRAFPYYAAQLTKGVALAPEFATRFTLAAPKALADLAQGKKGVGAEFVENIDPRFTQKQFVERFGLQKILDDMDQDITGSQRSVGEILKLVGESVGPATGVGYFATAGKAANQVRKELQKYVGTASAAKELEKSIEEKASSLQMTRREFNTLLAGGGIVGLIKALGLDTIFPAAKQVAKQAAPKVVSAGGTPKYFFDFVNLIKSKGKNISETASTVERQIVYDYKGYTLTEDLSTGKINIRKETEGGGSYPIGDGEYETVEGIMKVEEINYNPPEMILGKDGKPVKVPDNYSEDIMVPDIDGGLGDVQPGLDSIDEVLEILSEGGNKYTLKELKEMGINLNEVGDDLLLKILKNPSDLKVTKPRSKFDKKLDELRKNRSNKAGGGIMKMAGNDSGPPPKSGPTPHGLPYVAKNVRPIKERK